MFKPLFFSLAAAAMLFGAPAAAQPATATLEFEGTELGVWSEPRGWVSDDTLVLGAPRNESLADSRTKMWFWSREQSVFSLDIPQEARGVRYSGCALPGAVVWVNGRPNASRGYRSYLQRLDVVNGELRVSAEQMSPLNAGSETVAGEYTIPVATFPERAIFFARGGCRFVSTETLRAVIERTPSLQVGDYVQFVARPGGLWRAFPRQSRRIADNAVSIDFIEGNPFVDLDAEFRVIGEGTGGFTSRELQTAIGRYAYYPEARASGVMLADGRLWRTFLTNASADGCTVFEASHLNPNVIYMAGFQADSPMYNYRVIDLCSPANQAILAAAPRDKSLPSPGRRRHQQR
ncbi:MAG: hypothetical protein R3C30_03760 [Hyphomonadaceae bacterium]